MVSTWVLLALGSTLISSLVNVIDSHFMARRMPGWRAYLLICISFSLPVSLGMLAAFPLPAGLGAAPLAAILGATLASSLAVVIIMKAMQSQNVARISPLTSTSPVFVAVLAMVFLGEMLSFGQWLAIAAVVTGAVLVAFKWDTTGAGQFHIRPFLMMLAASLLIAVNNVANKYALEYMSFWNSAALIFFISSCLFLAVCVRPSVLRDIALLRQRTATIGFVLLNQAAAMVATVLAFWAIKLGPVALVSTVFNTKPLLILILSGLAGHLAPGFLLQETRSRRLLLVRSTATLLVTGGLVAMLTL